MGLAGQATTDAQSPGVSVIIIFLNDERFIAEAIESVLAQTYPHWEILLVDDGSSDGSTALAKEYVRKRPGQIAYLAHPGGQNQGMSASRNLGLEQARGHFVAFLDADDVYLPERLQRHVDILESMPDIDMVQSELIHWYSWEAASRRRDEDYVRPFLSYGDRILPPPEALMFAIAVPLYSAGICNITVRKDVALALGGFEPQFRAMYEDQVFLGKIYLERKTYVLQDCLARYRRHSGSWSRRAKEHGGFVDGQLNPETQAFHAWLCDYVQAKGVTHPLLLELLEPLQSARPPRRRLPRLAAKAKHALPRIIPRMLHRALLRWNRLHEFRRAGEQYGHLYARLSRYPLKSPTGPLVSVIMIFLDAERFIDEAIASVFAQTHSNWELLLVDDGSSDGSSRIARQFAASHSAKIRYIEHPGHANRGTGPSRNLGLAQAKGRYTAFLDADDIYLPERLARHVAVLERQPQVGLVMSPDLYWESWSQGIDKIIGPAPTAHTALAPMKLLEYTLRTRGAAMPGICSITFPRVLALDLGSIPERFVDQYEDQALIAKLMLATACVVLDEPLAKYRQHADSLTARAAQRGEYRPGRAHPRRFEFLQWLGEYAALASPGSTALQTVVHRQLWPMRHPALNANYEMLRTAVRRVRLAARPRSLSS